MAVAPEGPGGRAKTRAAGLGGALESARSLAVGFGAVKDGRLGERSQPG